MISRRSIQVAALCACAAGVLLHAPAAPAAVTAGNTGWAWGNPSPQVNSLTTLDRAGERLFAAGESGTLMLSDDHGTSWRAITTGVLEPVRHVEAIRETSVVFATRCGLRRTDDGGQTQRILPWSASQATCPAPIADVAFPSLSTGYLLLSDGTLLTAEDGGYVWNALPPVPGSAAAGGVAQPAAMAFTNRLNGVVLIGNSVLRTTDGGLTWVETASVTLPGAVDFADTSNGYVVGAAGGVWRTNDGGASFVPVPAGSGVGALGLTAVHCAAASRCIAVDRLTGGVAAIEPGTASLVGSPPLQSLGDAIATNGSILAVGAGGEIQRTADGGLTWERVSARLDAEYRGLHVESSRAAYAFGTRGAIAYTADGGFSWSDMSLPTTSTVLDLSADRARNGYALTSDHAVHRLASGNPDGKVKVGRARAVHLLGDAAMLLATEHGLVRRRFGQRAGKAKRNFNATGIDTARGAILGYGPKGAVVGTASGRRFEELNLPPTRSIKSLDFVSSSTGYVLDRFGELWFTDTGGRAWRRIDTTGDTSFTSVSFHDRENGFLASATGRILRTWDGGATWTRQFPFFDSGQDSPLLVAVSGTESAVALGIGTNRLLATVTAGQSGSDVRMQITEGDPLFRRQGSVQVSGRLLPAKGGEVVTLLARAKGSRPGAKWVSRTVVADAEGRFSSLWRIKQPTVFLARWSGDAARSATAASPLLLRAGRRP